MDDRLEFLRKLACDAMIALAENRWVDADEAFHPHATWWIIGQGELSHARVRALATETEGQLTKHDLRVMGTRSEEHTSELQSLMRISYAVFCLKKNNKST